jgi:glycosyltransferase involved in cell wall biosynthesis
LLEEQVHCIYVFRLTMAPLIKSYLCRRGPERPFCILDFDDYESQKYYRFAELAETRNDCAANAIRFRQHAEFLQGMESTYLRRFDQVYVCHDDDRRRLAADYSLREVHTAPNGIRIPAAETGDQVASGIPTLLFVGTLNYWPNRDALLWFCGEILPRIRTATEMRFRVIVVGANPTPEVLALREIPEVTVAGAVNSVEEFYSPGVIPIVPLRAGGGTRVKILEAFSHGRPVVSTSIGAEGLNLIDGEHILLADTAESFARQCVTLLHDQIQAEELGKRSREWVREHHSTEAIQRHLRELTPAYTSDPVPLTSLDIPRRFVF